jgi:hypothetical protein
MIATQLIEAVGPLLVSWPNDSLVVDDPATSQVRPEHQGRRCRRSLLDRPGQAEV